MISGAIDTPQGHFRNAEMRQCDHAGFMKCTWLPNNRRTGFNAALIGGFAVAILARFWVFNLLVDERSADDDEDGQGNRNAGSHGEVQVLLMPFIQILWGFLHKDVLDHQVHGTAQGSREQIQSLAYTLHVLWDLVVEQ